MLLFETFRFPLFLRDRENLGRATLQIVFVSGRSLEAIARNFEPNFEAGFSGFENPRKSNVFEVGPGMAFKGHVGHVSRIINRNCRLNMGALVQDDLPVFFLLHEKEQ